MRRELFIEKRTKPSKTESTWSEYVVERWFNKQGKLHSINGHPAMIRCDKNGDRFREEWHKNGLEHRNRDQPSVICYRNNKISSEFWSKNGIQHQDGDKPAEVWYDEDGKIKLKRWYKKGIIIKTIIY